eukprot:23442-Rhodomonas_salina.1
MRHPHGSWSPAARSSPLRGANHAQSCRHAIKEETREGGSGERAWRDGCKALRGGVGEDSMEEG